MDVQTDLDRLGAELRARGYRLTPQRMAILRVLLTDDSHPSAQQVYEQVKVDFPMVSLATIYSTIALLKEIGAVVEVGLSDDGSHYDGMNPYPHPHLVCVSCKEIIDIDATNLVDLPQAVAQRTGYQIVGHRLVVFGICPRCQEST